jgi:hypothetical protein
MGFINTFCTPIANKSIGYKYIYIFVGWDIIESILWYLFWYVSARCYFVVGLVVTLQPQLTCSPRSVESQGRSLEELEYIYAQPNPVKASLHVDKVIVQADGTVTEKVVENAI